jgi:hypothetical protein
VTENPNKAKVRASAFKAMGMIINKDRKTRFMCDFRYMGPETCEKYQHPPPLIQKILDNLKGARHFIPYWNFASQTYHIRFLTKENTKMAWRRNAEKSLKISKRN